MRSQIVGMTGVYSAAAELSRRGFIVSITSRNARGIDLLATDQDYHAAWSFQVKTNANKGDSWRLGHSDIIAEPNSFYIFVNLNGANAPEYAIAGSSLVAEKKQNEANPYIKRSSMPTGDGWDVFEEIAFRDLSWEDARRIAEKPVDYHTALLNRALRLLKPPRSNKADREKRKAIAHVLSQRTHVKPRGHRTHRVSHV